MVIQEWIEVQDIENAPGVRVFVNLNLVTHVWVDPHAKCTLYFSGQPPVSCIGESAGKLLAMLNDRKTNKG